MDMLRHFFEVASTVIEAVGVLVILAGCLFGTVRYLLHIAREGQRMAYHDFRRDLGRSIIVGLEYMIAGDIIRTVTVEASLQSAAVLAAIVLIRAFLTMTLELDIEGRWPWQRAVEAVPATKPPAA